MSEVSAMMELREAASEDDIDSFDVFSQAGQSGVDINSETIATDNTESFDLVAIAAGECTLDTSLGNENITIGLEEGRSEAVCLGVASAACVGCALRGDCPVLRMLNTVNKEQRTPDPGRESYLSELLRESDDPDNSLVIAGYVDQSEQPNISYADQKEAVSVSLPEVEQLNKKPTSKQNESWNATLTKEETEMASRKRSESTPPKTQTTEVTKPTSLINLIVNEPTTKIEKTVLSREGDEVELPLPQADPLKSLVKAAVNGAAELKTPELDRNDREHTDTKKKTAPEYTLQTVVSTAVDCVQYEDTNEEVQLINNVKLDEVMGLSYKTVEVPCLAPVVVPDNSRQEPLIVSPVKPEDASLQRVTLELELNSDPVGEEAVTTVAEKSTEQETSSTDTPVEVELMIPSDDADLAVSATRVDRTKQMTEACTEGVADKTNLKLPAENPEPKLIEIDEFLTQKDRTLSLDHSVTRSDPMNTIRDMKVMANEELMVGNNIDCDVECRISDQKTIKETAEVERPLFDYDYEYLLETGSLPPAQQDAIDTYPESESNDKGYDISMILEQLLGVVAVFKVLRLDCKKW